ncbi:MAG: hypothetical protein QNL04_08585 [SAR324 cluster bacterium]|nr:hypothetical protein [SAR324 cluster bacterium]
MKSSKDLANSFSETKIQRGKAARFDAHTHPDFVDRGDRYCLIATDLSGLKAKVGSKIYSLCDISSNGFSYAQHVPRKPGTPIRSEIERIEEAAMRMHDQYVNVSFSYTGKVNAPLTIKAKVCNHLIFFGLPIKDAEKEIYGFLFDRGIRKDDDLLRYAKGKAIIDLALKLQYKGQWGTSALLAMNMSLINFFNELGAQPHHFNNLWQAYEHRHLFLKYGLSIVDHEDAVKLANFANILAPEKPEPVAEGYIEEEVETEEEIEAAEEEEEAATYEPEKTTFTEMPTKKEANFEDWLDGDWEVDKDMDLKTD